MANNDTLALRALGALLDYPNDELRENLPEIREALVNARWFPRRLHAKLDSLLDELGCNEPLAAEARYVDLFDRGRRTSLYLFEHAYGESRDRGQAIVALIERYAQASLFPSTRELPDYLPVVLEFLSCGNMREARMLLQEAEPTLRQIGQTLQDKRSAYAVIFDALLALLKAKPLAPPCAEAPVDIDLAAMDAEWQEPPAFGKPQKEVINFYPNSAGNQSEVGS